MILITDNFKSTKCISETIFDFVKWKDLLSQYFKVPSNFNINSFHVFRAVSVERGILYIKKFSSSTTELRFYFNIANGNPLDVTALKDRHWEALWRSLSETPSRQHGTRQGYLMNKVIDSYYHYNYDVRAAFYGSGD